jgi:hypothetical protein
VSKLLAQDANAVVSEYADGEPVYREAAVVTISTTGEPGRIVITLDTDDEHEYRIECAAPRLAEVEIMDEVA